MNALADMKATQRRVAQAIARAHTAVVGGALPDGFAGRIAEEVIADLGLAVERAADQPGIRLVGKWEKES